MKKLYLYLILCFCTVLYGCIRSTDYKVVCNTGFETGLVSYAYVEDATLSYSKLDGTRVYKKLQSGESCEITLVHTHD